jgi:hypothetical protein
MKIFKPILKKNKFTRFYIPLFWTDKFKKKKHVKPQKTSVEGKIIRTINIITLDPFGYSDVDTTKTLKIGENEQETDYQN